MGRGFPVLDGRYAVEGFAAALAGIAALQIAVAWVLPFREPAQRPAS